MTTNQALSTQLCNEWSRIRINLFDRNEDMKWEDKKMQVWLFVWYQDSDIEEFGEADGQNFWCCCHLRLVPQQRFPKQMIYNY